MSSGCGLSSRPRSARRGSFSDEIERAYRSLSDFPDRGRPARPDFRELVVPFGRGAYILRYMVSRARGMVLVVRIWHGREKRE